MKTMHRKLGLFVLLICLVISCVSCGVQKNNDVSVPTFTEENETYGVVNENVPQFSDDEITVESFEFYSELDHLGRCGEAIACIGVDIMPTEERGAIGQIKPSGWKMAKYDIVDGKYLYNRCHLIGYQLTGENANEKNLITGTRYMNVDGMLPFENMVADYVKETKNHVMYRVTPVFEGDNLLASGVRMEAWSVEDDGKGISFNVFVNNIQPGIEIDYSDGSSRLIGEEDEPEAEKSTAPVSQGDTIYILNTNTKKFHYENCSSVKNMKPNNKETFNGTRDWLIENGYLPCGSCNP